MVVFVNRRITALVDALSPREAACAFARRLRQHVQAHDATTAALGIRAGRKRPGSKTKTRSDDESTGGEAAASLEDETLEEGDVQASESTFSGSKIIRGRGAPPFRGVPQLSQHSDTWFGFLDFA